MASGGEGLGKIIAAGEEGIAGEAGGGGRLQLRASQGLLLDCGS